jgi:hypothetical protein
MTPEAANWLLRLQPSAVVLSTDSADPASLASPALEAAMGSKRLLRTDQLGTIEFTTDGTTLWAASQRHPEDLPGL